MPNSKLLLLPELLEALKKRTDQTIVTTNGCFDLLHAGHVGYLDWAKAQGDCLVMLLNTDESVRRIKGPLRPINSEEDRAKVLAALEAIDYICFFDAETPVPELEAIRPNVHVKADQYTEESLPEATVLKAMGTRMAFSPMQDGISTTELISRINRAYASAT